MTNSYLKLQYSKKLLDNFGKKYRRFIESNYKIVQEDTRDGKTVARLRIHEQIPADWGMIIGDIIHNLRSALDLLISDLLIVNGNKPTESSSFPVSKSEKVFLDQGIRKVEGINDAAIEIIKELKLYKDGNPTLWELHQLDIIDKHRAIIPVVNENKAVVFDFGEHMNQIFGEDKLGKIPLIPLGLRPTDRQISDGIILFSAHKNFCIESSQFPKFEFELVFGKEEFLEGESISKKMNEYVQLVESIIKKFDSFLNG